MNTPRNTPAQRIIRAALIGRGVTFNAQEVRELAAMPAVLEAALEADQVQLNAALNQAPDTEGDTTTE